jgi:hypothetical protein
VAAFYIRHGAYLGSCERRQHHYGKEEESQFAVEEKSLVSENAVMKVYPNPFNDQIAVTFKTATSGKVNLTLYDMNSKLIATIHNGFAEKGILQKVEFKTGNLSPGTYFTRLQTEDGVSQQKIVLIR